MKHLAHMSVHDARTGMNSKNLAIVWAPNLLKYVLSQLLCNFSTIDNMATMFLLA